MDIIVIVAALATLGAAFWWCRDHGSYTRGRDVAVRQCDDCGQIQHMYCDSLESWDHTYWVANGEIKNPTCKCHKDSQ